jgi:outer membrane lipoprotein-sorting protein
MRRILCLTAAALALTAASTARADDKADTRAVIDKAIQATGGAEKLAKIKAVHFKGKGKFYGMGEGIDYTGEWNIQPPEKFRVQINFEINAMKITFVMVFDGKKGWRKINEDTMELNEDEVAEGKEDQYAGQVDMLIPLIKDKGFELSPLGESKVEDKAAVGIRVAHKGHRDINLFFDKKTGLLLKSERTIKDQQMGGKERMQESLHSDYKDIGGIQHPMKVLIKRDGEKYVEGEATDFETKDQTDDSVFVKP